MPLDRAMIGCAKTRFDKSFPNFRGQTKQDFQVRAADPIKFGSSAARKGKSADIERLALSSNSEKHFTETDTARPRKEDSKVRAEKMPFLRIHSSTFRA